MDSLNGPRQSRLLFYVPSQLLGEQASKLKQLWGHVHIHHEVLPRGSHLHRHPPPPTRTKSTSLRHSGRCHCSAARRYSWTMPHRYLALHCLGTSANETQKKFHQSPMEVENSRWESSYSRKLLTVSPAILIHNWAYWSSLSNRTGLSVVIVQSGPSSDSPVLTLSHSTNLSWLLRARGSIKPRAILTGSTSPSASKSRHSESLWSGVSGRTREQNCIHGDYSASQTIRTEPTYPWLGQLWRGQRGLLNHSG